MRFVLVLLFALGLDLPCSPVGFAFLVGDLVASCGMGVLPLPPTVCVPMVFQRPKSISTVVWGGGSCGSSMMWTLSAKVLEVRASISACSGGSELWQAAGIPELRKMNRSSSDSFVIFFFFRVLLVIRGLYCSPN